MAISSKTGQPPGPIGFENAWRPPWWPQLTSVDQRCGEMSPLRVFNLNISLNTGDTRIRTKNTYSDHFVNTHSE